MISPNTAAVQEEQQPRFLLKELIFLNIITRASVKERIHVEQIIRSQPHMHNSGLVDIVTIPVRKCLGLSMDVYKPVGEVKEPLPIILDVHGGGLIAGRKEQNRNLGIQLARRGYIVFIPDYRLVPETDIFGQISDILDALAVIEAKAAEFGGNIEKLFVTADSAGAFLASMAVASLHHPTEMMAQREVRFLYSSRILLQAAAAVLSLFRKRRFPERTDKTLCEAAENQPPVPSIRILQCKRSRPRFCRTSSGNGMGADGKR